MYIDGQYNTRGLAITLTIITHFKVILIVTSKLGVYFMYTQLAHMIPIHLSNRPGAEMCTTSPSTAVTLQEWEPHFNLSFIGAVFALSPY